MRRLIIFFILICISFLEIAIAGPLHNAIEKGDINKVKELITKGADVNEKDLDTPLELASYYGHADIVRLLVSNGANLNTSPLLLASKKGHKDIVEFLISKGMDVNSKNEHGSPIEQSVINNHTDIAELLINNGANREMIGNRFLQRR